MEAKFDSTNNEQRSAYRMIERTNNSFFLAGRAGTGKTTFLKNVQEGIKKKFVILAPTGQAAINAGGQTIHSFFGFNFGVLGPGEIGSMNRTKIGLVRNLDTIIIDEVSMVRCDIIDAIDRTLRHYVGNSAPFGGIQMVFVGDMFQLEPIATQKDRETLKDIYGHECFYFYKAAAIERINLPKIEFLKVYRQSDPGFIELLEHVRLGKMTVRDLIKINSRVSLCEDERMRITLCSTNADAKRINDGRLAEIDSEEKIYNAIYSGKTRVTSDVAEELLTLKVGAQVMFTKNDRSRRWVNGTIGEIIELGEENVTVKLESSEQYIVEKEDWESIDYEYDHEKKRCIKTVTGKVEQLPLRLAWAITIHKSQSLTFDHVAIDFGRGAFSNGQAYVALSRARTFDGLELLRPYFNVTALSVGSTSITFKDAKGKTAVLDVTVDPFEIGISDLLPRVGVGGVHTVEIEQGNGGYSVVSSDEKVVLAKMDGEDLFRLTGVGEGQATVTVTDAMEQSLSVNVTVVNAVNAADLGSGNYFSVPFTLDGVVDESFSGLDNITFESRINISSLNGDDNASINTVMGVEKIFLLRVDVHKGGSKDERYLQLSADDKGGIRYEGSTRIETNTWYDVAVVLDGSKSGSDRISLYVNGVKETLQLTNGNADELTDVDLTSNFYIGRSDGRRPLNGAITFARIWTRALSDTEIAANTGKTVPASTDGLAANWIFTDVISNASSFVSSAGSPYEAIAGSHITSWLADPALSPQE